MNSHLHRAPAHKKLAPAAPTIVERDASNFDFRVVTLLLVLITRPDLLKEYLDDGAEKDACNVPLAMDDPTKWKRLRTLFEPPMLAEMLYLFELKQSQECARHFRRVFQTMIALEEYDFDGCPNSNFVRGIVEYSRQQTAELDPAGTVEEPESEKY